MTLLLGTQPPPPVPRRPPRRQERPCPRNAFPLGPAGSRALGGHQGEVPHSLPLGLTPPSSLGFPKSPPYSRAAGHSEGYAGSRATRLGLNQALLSTCVPCGLTLSEPGFPHLSVGILTVLLSLLSWVVGTQGPLI